jgi:ribosomal protein S18 acetylase RimI-like enzyme
MTIQISNFANSHLPAIIQLLNNEYRDSYEFIPFDEERVLAQIRRRDIRILVAEENDEVVGIIGTHADERTEEHIQWLAAEEKHDGKVIQDMLLNEIEKTVRGDNLVAMVDEGSPRINDWINRGYELEPGYQRMSAKLDGFRPIPEVAQGIKLRSLRSDEEEKLVALVNTGFGWQRIELGDLQAWKSQDPPFSEDWVQVAEVDERIVSTVVAKPDTDYDRYLHLKRGYLGPAATLPDFRNKHLASALTARAMNFLFERGMDSVRLGTSEQNVSSIALLRSLGFHVDIVRKILRKKLKNESGNLAPKCDC